MRVCRVLGLSVIMGLALVCNGFCAKLEVGPGKRFQKIGPAIAAARNGDVIAIANGVYEESVIINKDLFIVGAGKKKCIISGQGPHMTLVDIKKGGIQGVSLVVTGEGPGLVMANVGAAFEIKDCIFDGKGTGETALRVEGASSIRIRDVVTRNFSGVGWELADASSLEARGCLWQKNDSFAVEASGSASFVGEKCTIKDGKSGFRFIEKARGAVESSVISGLAGTGLTATETRSVSLKKCTMKNVAVGVETREGGKVSSAQSTFESCDVFAVTCSGTSGFTGVQDRFINNHVAVVFDGESGGVGVDLTSPKFSNSIDGAILAMGEGALRMTSAVFSGEKRPVDLRDSVVVSLVKPSFKGIGAGGISVAGNSRLTLEDATLKNTPAGALTVKEAGRVVARRMEFSGGDKSPIVLSGSTAAEFEMCKWSKLDDAAIRVGEEVSVRMVDSTFTNVRIPIEAGMTSRVTMTKVDIKGSAHGVVIRDHARLEAKDVTIAKCDDICVLLDSDGPLLLSNLAVEGKTAGLACKGASQPVIDGMKASTKQIGLLVTEQSRCDAKKITLSKSARGIVVEQNAELLLDVGAVTASDQAVVVKDSAAVTLRDLTVDKSKTGLVADADADVTIESSSITAAEAALSLSGNVKFTGRKVIAASKKGAVRIAGRVALDVVDLTANLAASKGDCLILEGEPAGVIDGLKTNGAPSVCGPAGRWTWRSGTSISPVRRKPESAFPKPRIRPSSAGWCGIAGPAWTSAARQAPGSIR